MDKLNEDMRGGFKTLLAETGGVDSFTPSQAVAVMRKMIELLNIMGLNDNSAGDFLALYLELFNIELYNPPDFSNGKYLLTPNHVSEFDGPFFGVLHPDMLVMAKKEWTDNPTLSAFLTRFFKVAGVDRKDKMSGAFGLLKCIEHINNSDNAAVTIFVQQTIADVNTNIPEDVASGALSVSRRTGAAVIPVFCEQVSLDCPTRIVFGEPLNTINPKQFGADWLNAELRMQNSLTAPPARRPVLNEKHSIPISRRDF